MGMEGGLSDQEEPKQDEEHSEYKPSKWRVYLAWGLGVVALCYLIVAAVMFWNASTCTSVNVDQSAWARLWAGLTCMTANEMGDMLAGMFAPLAFLGLIIAILLQGQDLELQRADQALTRQVMEAQAKEAAASAVALSAQAEEAKRTAEFIGAQTQIASQAELRVECRTVVQRIELFLRDVGQSSDFGRAIFPIFRDIGVDMPDRIIQRLLQWIVDGRLAYRLNRDADDHEEIEVLHRHLVILKNLSENGSDALRYEFDHEGVVAACISLEYLMASHCPNSSWYEASQPSASETPVPADTGNAPKT